MKAAVSILAFLALTACADWPDTGAQAPVNRDAGWPDLLPLSQIVQSDAVPAERSETAPALAARANALRARAALLRRDAGTQAEMDALRARLAR